jgi:hypothetical protein
MDKDRQGAEKTGCKEAVKSSQGGKKTGMVLQMYRQGGIKKQAIGLLKRQEMGQQKLQGQGGIKRQAME